MGAITSLAKALETRGKYTDGHSKRVKDYSLAIAELKRCAGTQFDPKIANPFLEIKILGNNPNQSTVYF